MNAQATVRPEPASPRDDQSPNGKIPWSPLGMFLAVAFLVSPLAITLPVVWRSGEIGVVAHAIGFLLTGGAVVGALLYASTLEG
jgi:hypothetical protein